MIEFVATVALMASCGWTSYLAAARWLPDASTSVRLSGAAIVAYWTLIASFLALASLSLFRVEVAVPLWAGAAVLCHIRRGLGRRALETLRRDGRRMLSVWSELRQTRFGFVVLATTGGLLGLRMVRGAVAPPLTGDALTYHLLKAGRWVQQGNFAAERAPDAWGYYEYFQPFGDILWAWAMLPVGDDFLIGLAGATVWGTALLATYALARTLSADTIRAALAALFVAFSPSVFNFITTAQVENALLGAFVLGAVFIARTITHGERADTWFAAAAMGVLAGIKFIGAPIAVIGLAALVVGLFRHRPQVREGAARLAGVVLLFALGCQPYLRAWYETGSPSYPFTVGLGGTTLLAGNAQLAWLMARATPQPRSIFLELFVPNQFDIVIGRTQFLNPGPGALLVVVAGLMAAVVLLRRRPSRTIALFLLAASLVTIAAIATRDVVALRTLWLFWLGRFLLVPLAAAAVCASTLRRVGVPVLLAAIAVDVPFLVPLGLSASDASALGDWRLIGAVAGMVGMTLASVRWRRPVFVAGTLAVAAVSWFAVRDVRASHRQSYYRDMAHDRTYDNHWLGRAETAAYPIWARLDGAGETVAVSAGWSNGHNWFRYPLLGSRLQNRVVYVPITRDGSIVDYQDSAAVRARGDAEAWLRRLVEQRVDYLVLLHPEPPEAAWVRAHPDVFTAAGEGREGMARAYRLNLAAAAAALPVRHGRLATQRREPALVSAAFERAASVEPVTPAGVSR
jgi:hypothetical protein